MAERRMFAKTIIDSDAFLDMPQTSQLLYFHLSMRADDDGFINNPKAIMRNAKCSDDDMKILITKKFIIPFESGVVVIKHWKIHNYIAKDRYKETKYKEEKATLALDENNSYTTCIQPVYKMSTQVSIDKYSIDKDNINNINMSDPIIEPDTFIEIPLNDNTNYIFTNTLLQEYQELYPIVNVEQELKKYKAWCISNPTKRKTRRGILKSINLWLSKVQDKGGNNGKHNEKDYGGLDLSRFE